MQVMAFEEDEDRQRLDEMRNKRRIVYYTEEMQESKVRHCFISCCTLDVQRNHQAE